MNVTAPEYPKVAKLGGYRATPQWVARGIRDTVRDHFESSGAINSLTGNGRSFNADGPTGPPRRIKPEIISLAQQAKAAICPACVHYDNPWVLNSGD